jgi:hypothetical protein
MTSAKSAPAPAKPAPPLLDGSVEPTPFAPTLADAGLPVVFRRQLLSARPIVLEGTMDRVWRRRPLLRPLFSALALAHVVFPETGEDVPCRLEIRRVRGGQAWLRTFAFARERRFDAVLGWDGRRGVQLERFGPLELDWHVRFEPPACLEIRSGRARLRLGPLRLPVPRVLTPDVEAIERALSRHELHVEVVMSHRLLGPLFGYGGTFRLRGAPP